MTNIRRAIPLHRPLSTISKRPLPRRQPSTKERILLAASCIHPSFPEFGPKCQIFVDTFRGFSRHVPHLPTPRHLPSGLAKEQAHPYNSLTASSPRWSFRRPQQNHCVIRAGLTVWKASEKSQPAQGPHPYPALRSTHLLVACRGKSRSNTHRQKRGNRIFRPARSIPANTPYSQPPLAGWTANTCRQSPCGPANPRVRTRSLAKTRYLRALVQTQAQPLPESPPPCSTGKTGSAVKRQAAVRFFPQGTAREPR